MRLSIATRSLITNAGTFDRAAIMADAWVVYRKWYRHEPARLRERLANILRRLWDDAREQRAAFLCREAERAAFAAARARRAAAEASPAGQALLHEQAMLTYCDDWRFARRRAAEIDAALDRFAA